MGRACSQNERRQCFKNFKDKTVGKRPLGRPRHRWKGNTRMNIKEIGVCSKNWVDSAQDRDYWRILANAALNLQVP